MRASSPPVRRLSASCLQEELCALGHQLHIDPRYRDTRPIARSASSLYLANEPVGYYQPPPMAPSVTHFSPMRPLRRTPPPSIYIEEYQDEPAKEAGTSQESFGNFAAYSDAHQPLNEEGIASVAHSDEIPFIDDEEEEKQQQQAQRPCMASCSASSTSTVRRNTAAGYRKTVSFDLEQTEPPEVGATGIDRKYHTHDAISHYAAKDSSTESLMAEQSERIPLIQKIRRELNSKRATNCTADGFSSGGSGSNSQRSSSESIERMPLLRQNQSPCHRQLNTQRSHKRSGVAPMATAPIVSIQVPSVCEIESSCTRSPSVNTSNRYCARTTNTNTTTTIPSTTCRRASSQVNLSPRFLLPLGQGKVREMAAYFNAHKDFPLGINKSRSTSALDDTGSKPKPKLSQAEQGHILKQLKEWSLYGSAGKDYDAEPDKSGKTSCECPCCGHCRGKTSSSEKEQHRTEKQQTVATFKCYDSCLEDEVKADARPKPVAELDLVPEISRYASCRRSVMCSNRQAHSVRQLKRNKQQKQLNRAKHSSHPCHHQRRHHHHHCPSSPPSTAKLLLSLASSSNSGSGSGSGNTPSINKMSSKSCPNCGDTTDDCYSCSCSCSEAESCSSAGESSSSCYAAHCDSLKAGRAGGAGDDGDNADDAARGSWVAGTTPLGPSSSKTMCPTHR